MGGGGLTGVGIIRVGVDGGGLYGFREGAGSVWSGRGVGGGDGGVAGAALEINCKVNF